MLVLAQLLQLPAERPAGHDGASLALDGPDVCPGEPRVTLVVQQRVVGHSVARPGNRGECQQKLKKWF